MGVDGKKLCIPIGCGSRALAAVSRGIAESGTLCLESGLSTGYCCMDSRSCVESGLDPGLFQGRTSDSKLEVLTQ